MLGGRSCSKNYTVCLGWVSVVVAAIGYNAAKEGHALYQKYSLCVLYAFFIMLGYLLLCFVLYLCDTLSQGVVVLARGLVQWVFLLTILATVIR